MSVAMKSVEPTTAHLAYRKALEAAVGQQGATLDAADLLAITSHLVGQLVAMQDQRKMTPDMAMQIVSSNLEQGNREVVEGLLNETGGSA